VRSRAACRASSGGLEIHKALVLWQLSFDFASCVQCDVRHTPLLYLVSAPRCAARGVSRMERSDWCRGCCPHDRRRAPNAPSVACEPIDSRITVLMSVIRARRTVA